MNLSGMISATLYAGQLVVVKGHPGPGVHVKLAQQTPGFKFEILAVFALNWGRVRQFDRERITVGTIDPEFIV